MKYIHSLELQRIRTQPVTKSLSENCDCGHHTCAAYLKSLFRLALLSFNSMAFEPVSCHQVHRCEGYLCLKQIDKANNVSYPMSQA